MSRIGKQPIAIPSGIEVKLDAENRSITISKEKNNLSFDWKPEVAVSHDEESKKIVCSVAEGIEETRQARALWGTTRSRISNMVQGLEKGFERKLNIVGVGWNAQAQGRDIVLNIGYCHPIQETAPDGVDFDIEKGTAIKITGYDKQAVNQFAAVIRSRRKPEPYNGKGIMYHDEVIIRKAGKAFGV